MGFSAQTHCDKMRKDKRLFLLCVRGARVCVCEYFVCMFLVKRLQGTFNVSTGPIIYLRYMYICVCMCAHTRSAFALRLKAGREATERMR